MCLRDYFDFRKDAKHLSIKKKKCCTRGDVMSEQAQGLGTKRSGVRGRWSTGRTPVDDLTTY